MSKLPVEIFTTRELVQELMTRVMREGIGIVGDFPEWLWLRCVAEELHGKMRENYPTEVQDERDSEQNERGFGGKSAARDGRLHIQCRHTLTFGQHPVLGSGGSDGTE